MIDTWAGTFFSEYASASYQLKTRGLINKEEGKNG